MSALTLLLVVAVAFLRCDMQVSASQRLEYLKTQNSTTRQKIPDRVIIIGAGVSGARAAKELYDRGIEFLIVDARTEVGGRMMNAPLGHDVNVELGANWIHGFKDGHPLELYATKTCKLNSAPTDFSNTRIFDPPNPKGSSPFYTPITDKKEVEVRRRFNQAYDRTMRASDNYNRAISLKDALRKSGKWVARTPLECATQQSAVDYDSGDSAGRLSVWEVSRDVSGVKPQEEQMVLDNRGFKEVVKNLLKDAKAVEGKNLKLGKTVTKVEYRRRPAKVTFSDGSVEYGEAVLSTVSIGALKASAENKKNSIRFNPALSRRKKAALKKMSMSAYTKFFVRFKRDVFSKNEPVVLWPASCKEAAHVTNLERAEFLPGKNIAMVTFMSDASRRLSNMKDGAALLEALRVVSRVAGKSLSSKDVSHFARGKFIKDPLFRGMWSNRNVYFTSRNYNDLAKRQHLLFFAGEGVLPYDYGSVKTAWTSGENAGEQIRNWW